MMRAQMPPPASTCAGAPAKRLQRRAVGRAGHHRGQLGTGIAQGDSIGRVAWEGERIAGYCFADRDSGGAGAGPAAEYEGRGIGRQLLQDVVSLTRDAGHQRLFLACSADPRSRSHGFYRRWAGARPARLMRPVTRFLSWSE